MSIQALENQISALRAEKIRLEEKIEDLGNLKTKFTTLSGDFTGHQAQRTNNLNLEAAIPAENHIRPIYCEGMGALLSGTSYDTARLGLETACSVIDSAISKLELEVILNDQYLANAISDLEEAEAELARKKAEEAAQAGGAG